jgi:FK506-binding protein 1
MKQPPGYITLITSFQVTGSGLRLILNSDSFKGVAKPQSPPPPPPPPEVEEASPPPPPKEEIFNAEDEFEMPMMGVEVERVLAGDGITYPTTGDVLQMHYIGVLASNNFQFDSSRDGGPPIEFTVGVGEVIAGWDEGVCQMSLGEVVHATHTII